MMRTIVYCGGISSMYNKGYIQVMTRSHDWLATVIWLLILTTAVNATSGQESEHSGLHCRDSWLHNLSFPLFSQYTCMKCFVQVFMGTKLLTMKLHSEQPFLLHHVTAENITYFPEAREHSQVCQDYLTPDECSDWSACCQAAQQCCVSLATTPKTSASHCPGTWDGVACWEASTSAHLMHQACPTYFMTQEVSWLSPQASRSCDENGTWYTHPEHAVEMSDYDACFNETKNVQIITVSIYIDMAGRSLSLVFLLSSVLLLVCVKPLRLKLQHNDYLKLHLNLFLAVISLNTFTIIMDTVYLDGVTNAEPIHEENKVWCRVVHTFAKYFRSVAYMCMFCEGWHLHQQITNVMNVGASHWTPKYYLLSWGLPVITVLSYAICRAFISNENCWVDHKLSHLEFIHITPNIISLLCNLVFLVRIQWVLCTSLHRDPSDRSYTVVRQSLRATVSLVPIFGLHCLFVLYRPAWPPYELIAALFISTQGIIISVLYFFNSKDIKHELYSLCKQCSASPPDTHRSLPSVAYTKSSTFSSRYRSSQEAIYSKLPQRNSVNAHSAHRPSALAAKPLMSSDPPKEGTLTDARPPQVNGVLYSDMHPRAVFHVQHSAWNGLSSSCSVETGLPHSKNLSSQPTEEQDILLTTQANLESYNLPDIKFHTSLPTNEERDSSMTSRPS